MQSGEVFRVGTDAVLLGAMCSAENAESTLEVGTGCGIISLMIAQRNSETEILAIDINQNAAEIATLNFKNSPFSSRLKSECVDFSSFKSGEKFDLIVCNPPYFDVTPQSDRDAVARQKINLNFTQLISKASFYLNSVGIFSVIVPADMSLEFESLAEKASFYLSKKVFIFGRKGMGAKRVILEFKKEKSAAKISNFCIEKGPRVFSKDYLELTKDFHMFGKGKD